MTPPIQDESGYRLCHVEMPNIAEFNGWDKDGNPLFRGAVASLAEFVIEALFHGRKWNHTLVIEKGWSPKTDDGQLTGCMGSLQKNESDIALVAVEYPTEDYETIDPFAIYFEEPLVIQSVYNITNESKYTDILLGSLDSFRVSLWAMIAFAVVVSLTVSFIGQSIYSSKKKNLSAYQAIMGVISDFLSMLTDQDNSDVTSLRMLTICVSVFMFLIVNYYGNLMSTDLVVPQRPFLYDTLEHVMEKGAIPAYVTIFDTYRIFKDAPEGSLKKQFWDKYAHLEQSGGIFSNRSSMINDIHGIFCGHRISIVPDINSVILTAVSCQLKEEQDREDIALLRSTIFPDEKYQIGGVRNARLRYTKYGKHIKRNAGQVNEGGFQPMIRKQMSEGVVFASKPKEDHLRECDEGTYKDREAFLTNVIFLNFKSLWISCAAALFVSLVVLVLELVIRR